MIVRDIQKELLRLWKSYPVVTITGPRQSGKTTLAKATFPDFGYVNLESPDVRQIAETDANSFLKIFPPPLIIDEVQRVPQLLSYIQAAVDICGQNGQYLLTGSHQPRLSAEVAQSLAGRVGLLRLLPLSIRELAGAGIEMKRDEYLFKGFMPRGYVNDIEPVTLFSDYFSTYIERDVRQIINLKNLNAFETFIKLLAGRTGQLVNLSSLSNDVGVSAATISEWLSVLEASFIIFRLPCYFESFGKRLIKAQKLYFTEVGLTAWLLGIRNDAQVARDPLFGGLFENMVVVEALKTRLNAGLNPELYFFRDSAGFEVDLIFRKSSSYLIPIEIKGGMTWNAEFSSRIGKMRKLSPKFQNGFVIYGGELTPEINGTRFLNFKDIAEAIC
ncbi:MAG: ATP-binding protein [Synergistaceae bacterium]|nr:ATP-binding protein [Synergistaceae bacterium]